MLTDLIQRQLGIQTITIWVWQSYVQYGSQVYSVICWQPYGFVTCNFESVETEWIYVMDN